jgi:excisionase family DNA binding protein
MAGVMTDQGETFQRVSVAEAAAILGVSVATVRRRIRAGELEAETVLRPQGSAFVVRLPVQASAGVSDAYDSRQEPRDTMRTEASPEQAMLHLVQAAVTPILAPVMARMAEQEATIRQQAETIGELRASYRALEARTAPQSVDPTPEPSPAGWRPLLAWSPTVALLVMTLVLAVLLLVRVLLAPR